ncbi:SRPBCC family protein [Streptomyces sp. NBC_00344]|uniref:SRPBCC family protein n=1 Tax=Streptomyces sp. NBC_00344 TaxID=2975720 RepID=UPI002E1E77FC
MPHRLRPVGLDFVESAPLRLVFAAGVSAEPERVYRALAQETSAWPDWFGAVTLARPTAGGREVRLRGGARFQESVLAAEPPARYAYRADESSAPGLHALLEEWRLTATESGTRVQWTVAADGGAPLVTGLRIGRAGLRHAFHGAMRALDRRLTAGVARDAPFTKSSDR